MRGCWPQLKSLGIVNQEIFESAFQARLEAESIQETWVQKSMEVHLTYLTYLNISMSRYDYDLAHFFSTHLC